MKAKILCTLAAAALGWTATTHPLEALELDGYNIPKRISIPEKLTTRPLDPKSAIASWQWIGFSKSGTCPPVSGWKVENLLERMLAGTGYGRPEQAREALREETVALTAVGRPLNRDEAVDLAELRRMKLDRFCIYQATSSDLSFQKPDGLKAAKPDRMAVSPAGPEMSLGPTGMENWPNLAQLFMTHTDTAPLALRDEQPRVRLVFLDTQPDGEGVPQTVGSSYHGYTMAHLARRMICSEGDQGPCAAEIATRLALPYKKFQQDEHSPGVGGNLGLLADLTGAILREVWAWRRSGSPEHLVLNLSLGWDGEVFGDLKGRKLSKLDPSVQAVYKALRFASNRGALVIAAAGNRRGGPQKSDWPLLPAAWELRRPSLLPACFGRKPVYAVAGVDWQGLPLSNFRHGGRPRRAAYGDHAVAGTMNGGQEQPTMMYTGSSVSAAVTSSIAAVVWHLRPELEPAQVMRLIQRSGHRLASRADFYSWRKIWPLSLLPAPRMRRISLCKAVERSCQNGAQCPDLEALPQCQNGGPKSPQLLAGPSGKIIQEPRVEVSPTAFMPPCDPSKWLLSPGIVSLQAPCPTEQYRSMASQRWTGPQPEDPPCPGCPLKTSTADPTGKTYLLDLTISQEWQEAIGDDLKIKSATLDVERFVSGVSVGKSTYPLFDNFAWPSQLVSYSIAGSSTLANCTARINFEIVSENQPESIPNPVVVVYP